MKARIHYTLPDGSDDQIDIEGETVEDIRASANRELEARGATDPWSEILEE